MIIGWPFDCKQYVTDAGQLPRLVPFPVGFGAEVMVDINERLDNAEAEA